MLLHLGNVGRGEPLAVCPPFGETKAPGPEAEGERKRGPLPAIDLILSIQRHPVTDQHPHLLEIA